MSSHLNHVTQAELETLIQTEFTEKEIIAIDFRAIGNLILARSLTLSHEVNEKLLYPISKWLEDPKWIEKLPASENLSPNWAEYKRRQRRWSAKQKWLAAERLRLYREAIQKKRAFRKEINRVIGKASPNRKTGVALNQDFMAPIVSPFSPLEQHKEETKEKFRQVLSLSVSDLLPWKLFLLSDLAESKKLTELIVYYPEDTKKDIVSKLIHSLELERENRLTITQDRPFGDIIINPSENASEATITVTDHEGRDYHFDWLALNDRQKKKIIADIKSYKILTNRAEVQ